METLRGQSKNKAAKIAQAKKYGHLGSYLAWSYIPHSPSMLWDMSLAFTKYMEFRCDFLMVFRSFVSRWWSTYTPGTAMRSPSECIDNARIAFWILKPTPLFLSDFILVIFKKGCRRKSTIQLRLICGSAGEKQFCAHNALIWENLEVVRKSLNESRSLWNHSVRIRLVCRADKLPHGL